MTTPDRHPERIAATVRENDTLRGYRYTTHGDADANGNRVYVREDVAEAAVAEERQDKDLKVGLLKGERKDLQEETTALRRDLDSLQGQANMHIEGLFNQSATIETLKTETTALRRERDALLARVEKLRVALSTVERQTRGPGADEADARVAWDVAGDAILADNEASAAGKGAG